MFSHPFVIGLLNNTVEVRTVVNGRLVQTLALQTSAALCWRQRQQGRQIYVANTVQSSMPTAGIMTNLGISSDLKPAVSQIHLLTILDDPLMTPA